MKLKPIPQWLSGAIVLAGFLTLAWLERKRPLRKDIEPKFRHTVRNLALAAAGGVVVQFLEMPVVAHFTTLAESRRIGLLPQFGLPRWIEVPAAVLLIDYSMYWWHRLNHIVPILWRTHLPHHSDIDMDASTAFRFHFTELLASVPLRVLQIAGIGAGPFAFSLWQTLFAVSILFHHSKVELPFAWERRLLWFIVTPRMHAIHHSVVHVETDSNWSS